MTESLVAQCPHCHTRFRVTQEHLAAADGDVRCGVCLEVFNASNQAAPLTAPEPVPAPPMPAPTPSEAAWPHDELDLSHLELDAEVARLGALEEQRRAPTAPPAIAAPPAVTTPREEPAPAQGLAARRLQEDEEAFALPSLGALSAAREPEPESLRLPTEPEVAFEPEPLSVPLTAAEPEPALAPEPAFASEPEPEPAISPLPAVAPAAPLTALRTPLKPAPATPPAPLTAAPAERQEPALGRVEADEDERAEPGLGRLDDWQEPAAEPLSADRDRDDEAPAAKSAGVLRSEPEWQDDPLLDLHDEPLQLDSHQQRPHWGRRLLWLLLCLLALLGLAGQYVYYHFDELARQDSYRPLFVQACASLGCKVPSKVDVQQIRSSNLVVRSHPQFSGALRVDAILYNRAPFSQPFPMLELRFADLNGQLLASRRFKPGEYLNGELKGQDEMPPQTPIHIALDILDPGPRAVNYSLSFFSPE
ncbi:MULTISPECIES: DUF3426 domain-containing protein [Pseudomonas]|uniref:DUF3426 domain-containing protein n=1 Tax=Pseudomonas TaxID=286 RepID=UPI0002FBA69F|nr:MULTISPECIES: DUF3426 domain-containing protein [Pseudomonas]MDC7830950.1 zinc-ribbon domain-containing protein [Pseudomonas benzopyrenica]NRH44350.1 DUF3426 domain-containing protein [Pseudomonas sp. MS15a(2019)]SEP21243.1 MJ0042 family finger-like domain-containing protein [Pseudomonas sp. Snoq117.2]